ncbi:MAG: hypothetical protein N4J56_006497 [Chroococcidiopsis sp. SAG 2025]|nr:hypothetical protein [Chroococcidiopsis sp. SAG 2025]
MKYSYGDVVRGRVRRLFEILLSYADDELEGTEQLRSNLKVNWQLEEKQLVVRTKLRSLEALIEKDKLLGKLTKEQIREAINLLKDYLKVLIDNRESRQGSEDWHFTLQLWSKDKAENLRRFDAEWQAKLPPKSKLLPPCTESGDTSAKSEAKRVLLPNEVPTLILSSYVPQDEPRDAQLSYCSHIEEGHIIIQPDDPYLDAIRNSGENSFLELSPWSCEFTFPVLDVKLVNNTSQTLFFHEAIFQIKKSRLDPRPVPVIATRHNMMLSLKNIGWGPMENCVLRFTFVNSYDKNFYRTRSDCTPAIQYPFELRFNKIDIIDPISFFLHIQIFRLHVFSTKSVSI